MKKNYRFFFFLFCLAGSLPYKMNAQSPEEIRTFFGGLPIEREVTEIIGVAGLRPEFIATDCFATSMCWKLLSQPLLDSHCLEMFVVLEKDQRAWIETPKIWIEFFYPDHPASALKKSYKILKRTLSKKFGIGVNDNFFTALQYGQMITYPVNANPISGSIVLRWVTNNCKKSQSIIIEYWEGS